MPLIALYFPSVFFVWDFSIDRIKLKSRLWWSISPVSSRKNKRMKLGWSTCIRKRNFIQPPVLSCGCGWSLAISVHTCIVTSLTAQLMPGPCPFCILRGEDFNTYPLQRLSAFPIIRLHPSSSPSLAYCPEHQPQHSPAPELYNYFQREASIRFCKLPKKV